MVLGRTESLAEINDLWFMLILRHRVWVLDADSDGSYILRMRRYAK